MTKIAIFMIALLVLGRRSEYVAFHSSAFFKPSERVLVLDAKSKRADNLFKIEYSWLINTQHGQAWLKQVTKHKVEFEDYQYLSISKLLTDNFSIAFPCRSAYDLYHVGENLNGREHYLLKAKGLDKAIYYIATL